MAPDDILTAALDAVAQAATVARAVQRDPRRVPRIAKKDQSPVTVADFAVQALIAMALRRADPQALITGEEHTQDLRRDDHAAARAAVVDAVRLVHPEATEDEVLRAIDACDHEPVPGGARFWTLDPIDGTKGFLRGGQYAIALALIERGRVSLGVLGCPNLSPDLGADIQRPSERGVIVFAVADEGCFEVDQDRPHDPPGRVQREPLPIGHVPRVCRSVETERANERQAQRVLESMGTPWRDLRLDSQCKYAAVARGQADAYLRLPFGRNFRESIWDHAAGAIVATESGAAVTDAAGTPLDFSCGRRLEHNRGVICAELSLHARLIEAAATIGLDRAPESAPS